MGRQSSIVEELDKRVKRRQEEAQRGQMTVHDLKCWPDYFEPVLCGDKTAELRYNDRRYAVGDILLLREWDPVQGAYSGRLCKRLVTHVMHGVGTIGAIAPLRGLNAKYVMLSIREVVDVTTTHAAAAAAG